MIGAISTAGSLRFPGVTSLGYRLRVAVVTAGRADWGIYAPVLKAMQEARLDLNVLVTGTHLDDDRGNTWQEVKRDFPEQWRDCGGEDDFDFAFSSSSLIRPDWLFVLGDTLPMLEATLAAVQENIPVAHIHGGDRSGGLDDSIRHAITHFAHLHFPSSNEQRKRLLKLGEEDWRIRVVGPLGMWAMPSLRIVGATRERPFILVAQHPTHIERHQAGRQMLTTLEALLGLNVKVVAPNGDPGSEDIIRVIKDSGAKYIPSLPYSEWLNLLADADVLVGNSSCGIREAALYGTPVVDIGSRQQGREALGKVVHVPHDREAIRQAVDQAVKGGRHRPLPIPDLYRLGPRIIADRIANEPVNPRLLQKRIAY